MAHQLQNSCDVSSSEHPDLGHNSSSENVGAAYVARILKYARCAVAREWKFTPLIEDEFLQDVSAGEIDQILKAASEVAFIWTSLEAQLRAFQAKRVDRR